MSIFTHDAETKRALDLLTSHGYGIVGHNVEPSKTDVEGAINILIGLGYGVQAPGVTLKQTYDSDTVIGIPSNTQLASGAHAFFGYLRQMWLTFLAKNTGYAGALDPLDSFANFRECEDFEISAFTGILVRMGDKWSRIKSLHKKASNEQVGESLQDTLLDLANYAIIARCVLAEQYVHQAHEDSWNDALEATKAPPSYSDGIYRGILNGRE